MSQNYASKMDRWTKLYVGYIEKKSDAQLEDKTANAGHGNYTIFGKKMHQLYPSVMDFPAAWCDAFVDCGFMECYGIANAKGLLGGDFNDYTVASAQLYKNKGAYYKSNPKYGDQIFFNNGVKICHTGWVYKVTKTRVYVREGNASSAAGVTPNGGMVVEKSYALSYKRIDGYGRPKYDAEPTGFVKDGLDYSLVFNPTEYANNYADLKAAFGANEAQLFEHFLNHGMREGRIAKATFNVHRYKQLYADLRNAFGDDLKKYYQHYITDGNREGRIAV